MVKQSFSFCLLLFVLQIANAQTVNTNISNGVIFDGEPYLAINPVNNQNMVAVWMGFKYSGGLFRIAIKTRASFDGGNSWSTAVALPHFGTGFGSADPSLAFDKNGLLYVCYIDYKQAPDSGGIYVARSTDGGLNWDTPSKAFDMYDVPNKRPIDRPWLVVDNSNTSNSGTLYITTKPAPWIAPPNRNYFKVSLDNGHTWSTIANVDGGTHLVGSLIAQPMAAPATTLSGKFCAVYPSYVASQNPLPAYYLATSADKGQSFSYSNVFAAIPASNDTNFKLGYQLITDPADSNRMVFLIPDAQNGDNDIFAFRSSNGGQSWNGPVRINDDALSNGKAQDMVWGAYNTTGGLIVTWRDRRDASSNGFWNAGYDFYYATSTDNGQTFSANQKLSSQFITFDSVISQSGNDFLGCTYSGDTLCSVWGDTRNGRMNIYFAKTIAGTNTSVEIMLLNGEGPQWNIYPNPVHEELNVAASAELAGKEVRIYNASGKKISSYMLKEMNEKISIKGFKAGIYFIKIDDDVKRFVVE
ncbi:MAG: T9SS type A sorting domain-containing protein [Bacteroidota bacterium]